MHTVIFDLDGTLSDSVILAKAAFERLAPKHGLPIPSEDAIRRATGYANPEFYYILFPDFPRETVYNLGVLVEQEELEQLPLVSDRLLFEGCRELLERLQQYKLRLCLASTGEKDHVYSILGKTGIMGFFDVIACARPDKTEMLREIIGDSGKSGCIMVGDMVKDHDAARANGILSVGACYGYCVREPSRGLSGFDFYIDTPLELLDILKLQEIKCHL